MDHMNTILTKESYEAPTVEVFGFQTSGSILTASNEIIPITPISPFAAPDDGILGSSFDEGLYF